MNFGDLYVKRGILREKVMLLGENTLCKSSSYSYSRGNLPSCIDLNHKQESRISSNFFAESVSDICSGGDFIKNELIGLASLNFLFLCNK